MIFCVEDDESVRELMVYTLNMAGLKAEGFADGIAFREALGERKPLLIMLDIMLPGEDGISILKSLRSSAATAHIPVIMTTARGTEYDKVTGLDLGADDYLVKPFGMMEMVSRVRAVLRRSAPVQAGEKLRAGVLELDTARRRVTVQGECVELTRKEYELLLVFMKNPGLVFTREQLLGSVWGTDFAGETRTVDVHIGTLRMKLGQCGAFIETVRGVGYRMEEKA